MILDFLSTARHLIERSLDNWHLRANRKLFGYGPYINLLGRAEWRSWCYLVVSLLTFSYDIPTDFSNLTLLFHVAYISWLLYFWIVYNLKGVLQAFQTRKNWVNSSVALTHQLCGMRQHIRTSVRDLVPTTRTPASSIPVHLTIGEPALSI